jgi:hypothetical protein
MSDDDMRQAQARLAKALDDMTRGELTKALIGAELPPPSEAPAPALTLALIEEAINRLPVQWYAISDTLPKGKLFSFPATEMNPEFILLHPDDLEFMKREVAARFRHIREWRRP